MRILVITWFLWSFGQAGAFFGSARNAATTVQQQRADTENGSDRPLLQEQVQYVSLTVWVSLFLKVFFLFSNVFWVYNFFNVAGTKGSVHHRRCRPSLQSKAGWVLLQVLFPKQKLYPLSVFFSGPLVVICFSDKLQLRILLLIQPVGGFAYHSLHVW